MYFKWESNRELTESSLIVINNKYWISPPILIERKRARGFKVKYKYQVSYRKDNSSELLPLNIYFNIDQARFYLKKYMGC